MYKKFMTILTSETVTWRKYQKQLLERLPNYKENQSVHLVVPPGSGKTYLGIEIIRQLNEKTLILVPSLVLKQQWIRTIQTIFLKKTANRSEVSDSIDSLKMITVETYQTIYSRLKNDPTFFKREKIGVLVLDEAHHLKKSWGEVLLALKIEAPELITVSLTATPPYDADLQEWQQYQLLNGPIDEEIAIPQLIKEQALAPHQDYLYLVSAPTGIVARYEEFMQNQSEIVETIVASTEISNCLLQKDFIQNPIEHEEFIYQFFDVYLSALLFLHLHGYQLEEQHWHMLGVSRSQGEKLSFPTLEKKHMIHLLTYLYDCDPKLSLFTYLESKGWLVQNQLQLFPEFSDRIVNQAPVEKKEAICRILLCEYEKMGRELCGLVLTDFIKKEVLAGKNGELEYGLIPIFDYLVPFFSEDVNLAAVCGEFLIISKEFQTLFSDISIKITEHPYFSEYVVVYSNEQMRSKALTIVTELVDQKAIQLLIGTSSLLGEGWNCPAINTVVLANHSTSFTQTQQLRGRGLRMHKKGKTTNIWHLAVVLPGLDFSKQIDLNRIMKRMGYICGLTFETQPVIESGVERFDLISVSSGKEIAVYNQEMLYWCNEREQLEQRWKQGLEKGNHLTMPLIIRKQAEDKPTTPLLVVKSQAAKYFDKGRLYSGIGIAVLSIAGIFSMIADPILGGMIFGVDGLAILATFNREKVLETYQVYVGKKEWQKEVNHIRHLVLSITETFVELGIFESDALKRITINVSTSECTCYFTQANYQEERLFHTTMKEVLSPIENPRYFIYLKNSEILSVPEIFGRNKKTAMIYQCAINHYFSGKSNLIYSRTLEGRKKLVQAKLVKHTLYRNSLPKEVIQKNIWI